MNLDPQTRRQFCSRTCSAAAVAALGGAFGAVLQSCGGGSPTSPGGVNAASLPTIAGTVSGGSILVTIDAGSPLAAVGSVALVTSGAGSALVARTSPDAFSALSSTCTHAGCAITGYSGQTFVCLPRRPVRQQRPRPERPRPDRAPAVLDPVRERRADDQRLSHSAHDAPGTV